MLFKGAAYSKVFTYLILYFAVIIYQTLLAEFFTLGSVRLDLAMILLAYVSLTMGARQGIIFGFGLGLLMDVLNPLWLGAGVLIKGTMGFGMGYLKENLFVENVIAKGLVLFGAILINDLLINLFLFQIDLGKIGPLLLQTTLWSAIYTTAVSGIFLFILRL
jgi:rod shape-determining protein MreD